MAVSLRADSSFLQSVGHVAVLPVFTGGIYYRYRASVAVSLRADGSFSLSVEHVAVLPAGTRAASVFVLWHQ